MAQNLGKSILTLGVDGSQMTAGLNKAQQDINKTGKSAKDLDGRLRLMRGGVGQLGHQIQDMAVQAQMGTDAFIILGQQGSQVAALLGPGGAMFGAVLAIGAAIAGPLVKSLTQSNDILEELEENARATTASLHSLSGAQRAVAEQVLRAKEKELIDAVAQAWKILEAAEESHISKSVTKTRGGVNQNANAFKEASESVDRYKLQLGLAEAELEDVRNHYLE